MRHIILASIALLITFTALGSQKIVHLSVFNIKPYYAPELDHGGLAIEVLHEAFAREGWILNTVEYPTLRASRNVSNGVIDGFFMATVNFKSPDFIYSDPYIETKLILLGSKKNPFEFTGMQSLADKQIGAILGWGLSNAFTQLNWTEVPTVKQLFNMLDYKRIDAFMYEEYATNYNISLLPKEKQEDVVVLNGNMSPIFYGIAIDKNNPRAEEIILAFNSGLASMKEDGTLAKKIMHYQYEYPKSPG